MKILINYLQVASLVCLSSFIGVMICVYTSHYLVWVQLEADEFFHLFAISSKGISYATGATGIASLLICFITILFAWNNKISRIYWLVSYILLLFIILITAFYFVDVNKSFAAKSIPVTSLILTLGTWGQLHVLRIFLGVISASFAGFAIVKSLKFDSKI
ncbi:MAG: DUF1772 domain-containing protein [bacterium]|nr:DUF1772 domain-containing protein [bacterium]